MFVYEVNIVTRYSVISSVKQGEGVGVWFYVLK